MLTRTHEVQRGNCGKQRQPPIVSSTSQRREQRGRGRQPIMDMLFDSVIAVVPNHLVHNPVAPTLRTAVPTPRVCVAQHASERRRHCSRLAEVCRHAGGGRRSKA